ncbi:MAG: ATP-dependent endonuclease [Crocinitomicaceae bacterium]|nr:ATP-dependent endonuclease [Crocinitomicaceae bacterium]|tara:strand:- start:132 stop:1553 length:1422 start_codon:yes stop_codon:yes gene_type:complete
MPSNYQKEISDRLRSQFHQVPTNGQQRLIEAFSRFVVSEKPKCALILKGYAGTGKTTSIGAIVRTLLEIRKTFVMLAPTGRAAKVMAAYSGISAHTIHRFIYRGKTDKDGDRGYTIAKNKFKNAVFIVDEASMIGLGSGLLDDLIQYVFSGKNCRLMLVGDGAQLPPVGCNTSPALNLSTLKMDYGLTVAEIELTEVVRQELNSSILLNAHKLRLGIDGSKAGSRVSTPVFDLHAGPDVVKLKGEDLQETIEDLHNKYGQDGVVVVTRSNKRAVLFNQQIRNRILWQEDDINIGDRLMVVKNNYYWLRDYDEVSDELIANGDIVEVVRILDRFERYGHKYAEVDVILFDLENSPHLSLTVMTTLLNDNRPSLSMNENKDLYKKIADDYLDLGSKSKIHSAVIRDQCYQALHVKFAYSLTCHKAQGGQWPAIILDQGYLTEEMMDREWLRWLYTGFTRAVKELHLLNFNKNFFQ